MGRDPQSSVGESTSRQGENIKKHKGKEAGRHDTARKGSPQRPTGKSTNRGSDLHQPSKRSTPDSERRAASVGEAGNGRMRDAPAAGGEPPRHAGTLLETDHLMGHGGRMGRVVAFMLLLVTTLLGGCFVPEGRHTMRFELVNEPAGTVVTETRSYFFWGLAPTVRVDVLEKCPYGTVTIVDGTPGHVRFPTLGLWSRRSTTYYCRQPPA